MKIQLREHTKNEKTDTEESERIRSIARTQKTLKEDSDSVIPRWGCNKDPVAGAYKVSVWELGFG